MADGLFVGLSILTVGSAIISLESREILYGGIALAVSMLGIAGYFIILDAPFVAMFQIAVYVGAVAVLIIFTVMLVRSPNTITKRETKKAKIAGILIGIVFLAFVIPLIGTSVNKQFRSSDQRYNECKKDYTYKYPCNFSLFCLSFCNCIRRSN